MADAEPVRILPTSEVEALGLAELRALLSTLPANSLPNLDINESMYVPVLVLFSTLSLLRTVVKSRSAPSGSGALPVPLDDDKDDDWLSPQTQHVEADKPDYRRRDRTKPPCQCGFRAPTKSARARDTLQKRRG
ncbi:hypothetical protein FRC12_003516 [Ceratobasidium sp. 428]|nr:hypothetical protein FRC12_003516 [Ceratobasidium sp. 428]